MRLYVDNISALHAWRHDRNIRACANNKSQAPAFRDLPMRAADLYDAPFVPFNIGSEPLHLACGSALGRVGRKDCVHHIHAEPLIRGMFCKITNELYVASPEQVFLEAAAHLTRMQLVQLGMELCGQYSLTLDEPGGFTKWKDPTPITTPQRIEGHIAKLPGCRGAKMARSALKYVVAGAASPAETRLYMRLHMPRRYNAYGLKAACLLNPEFKLDDEIAAKLERARVIPDLYYPRRNVVVEYDSRTYHAESTKIEFDSRRRNLILGMGAQVFTVTAGIMANPNEFDKFVFELKQALGIKNCERSSYNELQLHKVLVAELNATSTLEGALSLERIAPKAAQWALPAFDSELLRT